MLLSTSDKCLICFRQLTLHEKHSGQICSDWRCRARQLEDALQKARAAAAQDLQLESVDAFPIVVVPWRSNPLIELSAKQRNELEDFLLNLLTTVPQIMDESTAQTDSDTGAEVPATSAPTDQETDRLLAKICAVCRGFCCFYGATRHAFLDIETMRRFCDQRPGWSTNDVVAEYSRYLPARHCETSCVYHAETGCALPRDMRADICNRYECHGLKDARREYAEFARLSACVVVRHDNSIVGCTFVDASGLLEGGTSVPNK